MSYLFERAWQAEEASDERRLAATVDFGWLGAPIAPRRVAEALRATDCSATVQHCLMAIALVESGLTRDGQFRCWERAFHDNGAGGIDRGVWQINTRWHPEVSDDEAYTLATAAREAVRISDDGNQLDQWVSWSDYLDKPKLDYWRAENPPLFRRLEDYWRRAGLAVYNDIMLPRGLPTETLRRI